MNKFRDLPEDDENWVETPELSDRMWDELLSRVKEGLEDCSECNQLATDVQFGIPVCEACRI